MNTTQQVTEFLSHPDLPFGSEEDVLFLADPQALQARVAALLEEFPAVLGSGTRELQAHLPEADWPLIAREFSARMHLAAGFFEADAKGETHAAPAADSGEAAV